MDTPKGAIKRELEIISAEELEHNAESLVELQEHSGSIDQTPIQFYADAAQIRLKAGDSRGAERDYKRASELARKLAEHDATYDRRNFLLNLYGKRPGAAVAAIMGIIGGLSLLYPTITGNAILNDPSNTPAFFGALLLFVGFIAAYFSVKANSR